MDHSKMGHDMPGMGDGDSGEMCSMDMTLNAAYKNVCILSKKWHVHTKAEMVLSMVAIVLLTMGYELYKRWSVMFDKRYNDAVSNGTATAKELKMLRVKASLAYGAGVFYSFLIMLVFMTFNIWVMLAVTIGAALGHYFFASSAGGVTLACH